MNLHEWQLPAGCAFENDVEPSSIFSYFVSLTFEELARLLYK